MSWKDVDKERFISQEERETVESIADLPYFAYGSNLYNIQMSTRCPDAKFISTGTLEDYRLVFRKVADVTKRKNFEVPGVLYSMSKKDIYTLNRYEGFPHKYIIQTGLVRVEANRYIEAFWYEIKNKRQHLSAEPSGLYFAKIASGYASNGLESAELFNSIRRAINAVNARKRREALKQMELEAKYASLTWSGDLGWFDDSKYW